MATEWVELLRLAGPAITGDPAFTRGFMRAQERKRQQQQQEQQAALARRDKGAQFKLDMLTQLMQLDDPVVFQQVKDAASEASASMFGMSPDDWADVSFPESKSTAKQIKELDALLDRLEGRGYNLDELAEAGSAVQTADGRSVSVGSALELTRRSPISAKGQRVPAPTTPQTAGSETERAAALRLQIEDAMAKGDGARAERLNAQYRNLLETKREMGESGRAERDPRLTELDITLKELQAQLMRDRANSPPEQLVQVTELDPMTGEMVTRLVPRQPGEVSRRPPPDPNQGQFTAAGYAGRMEQAETILASLESEIAGMNPISFDIQKALDRPWLQSDTVQSYMQAARNFINAVLRRESGAVISPSEFAEARQQYLPQPGDSPENLAQKKANRQYVFETMKRAGGRAYEPPPRPPGATSGAGSVQVGGIVTHQGKRYRVVRIENGEAVLELVP